MGKKTWDEMKLERDGHLSPTTVDAKDHQWVRPVFVPIGRAENGNILCRIAGGRDVVEFGVGDRSGPVALHLGSRRNSG